jgi:GNAT superfamily N-acetyltransferase
MNDLPEDLFANPVWHALHTEHRGFAIIPRDARHSGAACRYPADVVPFAAVSAPTIDAMRQLHSLLGHGEFTWLIGKRFPQIPALVCEGTLECLQMVLPETIALPDPATDVIRLSSENAQEMVALTTLAFPGFFRQRTCEMGSYYGIRSSSGELIAMGGERLKLNGFSEISGVCTHPSFRGRGFAARLIWQVVRGHRLGGIVSWLHVASANQHAIELYLRMGFEVVRTVILHRISRQD